jgi:hypothetical protein
MVDMDAAIVVSDIRLAWWELRVIGADVGFWPFQGLRLSSVAERPDLRPVSLDRSSRGASFSRRAVP